MMQIPYRDIWSMLLSGQVLHIEAIQGTYFGIWKTLRKTLR